MPRRVPWALAAFGCVWLVARLAAQEPAPTDQTFRTGIDVIRLDVSVFDKDRRPVRGLTAGDFVIKEDGRVQRIVAVTEVDGRLSDQMPSAWMRHAPRDVASNDLGDDLAEGQAVAIVLDDFSIPDDSVEMAVSTREIARFIINSLGPSDVAAIVYPFKPGRTQDFTRDRFKLFAAIDKFDPEQPEWRWLQPRHSGPLVGDIQRYNTAIGRDPCLQLQPVFPTLRTVTSRLAAVPNRRKALFFLSTGLAFTFRPGNSRCQSLLYDEMRRTFETAQRFNVNIHGVDPAGAAGYQRYLQEPRIRHVRMQPGRDLIDARAIASRRHDFLELLGEQTGGRPITDSDDLEASVAQIFEEYGSYYLIGYETTNGDPDGKFRRLDVDVPGHDVTVRTKSGRWSPDPGSVVADDGPRAVTCVFECWHAQPAPSSFHLSGLMPNQPLRIRAAVYPLAPASAPMTAGAATPVEVAAVLTIRLPAVLRSADDTLALVRTTYDDEGTSSVPIQDTYRRHFEPGAGDETRYDIWTRFTLTPGRHQVRFNATSRIADASGTVIVDVDVPDFSRTGPSLSAIVLGSRASEAAERPLAALLPIVPTTVRDFTRGERVTAMVRLFAGASAPAEPVAITTRLLGADDREAAVVPPATIAADAFAATGATEYLLDLPLASLPSGLHLLSMTATFEGRRSVRRDVVFRVR